MEINAISLCRKSSINYSLSQYVNMGIYRKGKCEMNKGVSPSCARGRAFRYYSATSPGCKGFSGVAAAIPHPKKVAGYRIQVAGLLMDNVVAVSVGR